MATVLAETWGERLAGQPRAPHVEVLAGRAGHPTLRVQGALLHSQYNPVQEAARWVEGLTLAKGSPVVVFGLGMGYHVQALMAAGHAVLAVEPDEGVAAAALAEGAARAGYLLCIGALDEAAKDFLAKKPIFVAHPASARLHPEAVQAAEAEVAVAALRGLRLNVAVVGPMYGGSAPITEYLVNGFRKLGHNAAFIDNTSGWELYDRVTKSVKDPTASAQLGTLVTNLLSEWTYARVAEFDPEICIVMAQAPVAANFPARLAKNGTVCAYWYVENWRHMRYWDSVAPAYDAFFHIQPGEFEEKLTAAGCAHHAFVQTGCDPDFHKPVRLSEDERADYDCDISFAGAGYFNRLQVFKGLTDYKFKIWGVEWPERELVPLVQGGEKRFDNDTFMKIVAGTRVSLNLHSSNAHEAVDPRCDALNPRVFEIAAAGGFQVCDPCIGLDRHFAEDEVPTYRSLRELRDRIDHYLAHPKERAACAERAQARALREHTYEQRAAEMLGHLLHWHGARIRKRGVRVQRTIAEAAAELPQGDELREYLETLPGELTFNQDTINVLLAPPMGGLSRPEQLLCYMREIRNFTEALLRAPR